MNRPVLSCFLAAPIVGVAAFSTAFANDPPLVEHQPAQCTVAQKPIELCASVLDDGEIAKVRTYFRKPDDKYYYVAEMAFEGARFCTTLPAINEGKLRSLEYYIDAIDTEYEKKRTSTYRLLVQNEVECGFPPIQTDAKKASSIVVLATSEKQGKKLPNFLDPTGVTYVPMDRED